MIPRKHVGTATAFVWGCSLLCLSQSGCGPQGGNGGANRISAADCAQLAADAVSLNSQATSGLAGSAVTPQCEQIAVYNEGGQTKEIAISIPGQDRPVIAVYGADGTLTAVRSAGDTVTSSNNTALGFSRVESNGASTLVVNRGNSTNGKRSASQAGGSPAFCDDLMEFSDLMEGGCESNPSLPYCDGPIGQAAAAARRLCESQNIQEVEGIDDLAFGSTAEGVDLGVDGLYTTRPAASGGTTVILAAVAFGGVAPYQIAWSQTSGSPVTIEHLGNSAIADLAVAANSYQFEVQVTDAEGTRVSDRVDIDLGARGSDLIAIDFSPVQPSSGAAVSFSFRTGAAPGSEDPTDCVWNFGEAGSGSNIATGPTATHVYAAQGTYMVTLVCDTTGGLRTVSTTVPVDGGGDEGFTPFAVLLDVDTSPMAVGERRVVNATTEGAIGTAEVAIVSGGPASLVEGAINAQSVAFSSVATLTALEPGLIAVGAVGVDAAGNVAETVVGIAACDAQGGLFAEILGPLFLVQNESTTALLAAASCEGDGALTFNWSVIEGDVSLSNSRVANPRLTALGTGTAIVGVTITDSAGHVIQDSIGIEIIPEIFGEFCIPDDGFCDDFCDVEDPDCNLCGLADGVCVLLCPFEEDPDCVVGVCVPNDGICDFDCASPDPDCDSEFCLVDDGLCDFPCPGGLDPDCAGFTNDDLCIELGYCCSDDEFCDIGCPTFDPGCDFCEADGHCVLDCPNADPDCDDLGDFCNDGVCDVVFGEDPFNCPQDCAGLCGDGVCGLDEDEFFCPEDCGFGGFCGDGFCGFDEDEFFCPEDCVFTICGDLFCDFGEEITCPLDCF